MLHEIAKSNVELRHLTTILNSDLKLSSTLFEQIAKNFRHTNIIEFFGTSEASFISYNINRKASVDSVGYIFQNERLIIGGKNVHPQVIEQMIKNIDGVEEVMVIGEPHPRFGEIAVLLYTGSIELEYQTVRQHIMKVLSRYDVPSKLIKVDRMQYTQSGKVARNKMRTAYVKGGFK